MKKLFFILIALTFISTSCKKEVIEPNQNEVVPTEEGILLYGEWKLVSGKMFVENMETDERVVYDHFSSTKPTSSLRYSGAEFEFETIEQNVTTWEFIAPPNYQGYGQFILDGDTLQPYGLYILNDNWSIVEDPTATTGTTQLGGSSRPIQAVVSNYDNNQVVFTVQEAYESIDGYNSNYYSELTFEKL